jgi:hypothetical protein
MLIKLIIKKIFCLLTAVREFKYKKEHSKGRKSLRTNLLKIFQPILMPMNYFCKSPKSTMVYIWASKILTRL